MRYFSTFSGIAGFELGIFNALGVQSRFPVECVGYSEIDKYAIQVYQKHFPEHKNYGDITKIDATTLPDFDFLCGGFPCQTFSVAGKRAGFNDTRGTLFFDLARILQTKRPKSFLFENVKGLLSHDNGRTFRTIISTIDELGYDVQWQVLNSKDFGVPQNRERVFISGHIRGEPRPKIFPLWGSSEEDNGENKSTAIDANYGKGIDNHGQRTHIGTIRTYKDGQGFREVKQRISPTIAARAREDGNGQPVLAIPTKFLNRNQKNFQGEYSFTVDTLGTGGVMADYQIRRLTPIECERLQGFPDNWTHGMSDTQRYKCLGNAVTVNVIQYLVSKLYDYS